MKEFRKINKEIKKNVKKLYSWFVLDQNMGFQDGGCWMFASALVEKYSFMELYCVFRDEKNAEHVVAKFDFNETNYFVDSDGIFTETQIIEKTKMEIVKKGVLSLKPFDGDQDIPYNRDVVDKIVSEMDIDFSFFENQKLSF